MSELRIGYWYYCRDAPCGGKKPNAAFLAESSVVGLLRVATFRARQLGFQNIDIDTWSFSSYRTKHPSETIGGEVEAEEVLRARVPVPRLR